MNIKAQWIEEFEEKLWEHHTCDWDPGNRNPIYYYKRTIGFDEVLFLIQYGELTHYNIFKEGIWREIR